MGYVICICKQDLAVSQKKKILQSTVLGERITKVMMEKGLISLSLVDLERKTKNQYRWWKLVKEILIIP